MSELVIKLNYPNCGGSLGIHDDMDGFACGYCGTQLSVRRQEGIVSLQRVTEAIQRVQVGTDKTAAELAIARYEKELRALYAELNHVSTARLSRHQWIYIIIVIACLIPTLTLWEDNRVVAVTIAITCAIVGIVWRILFQLSGKSVEEKRLSMLIRSCEGRLATNRQIADK